MDQLLLKDFLNYRFLSQPKFAPGGKRAAFVVSNANEEESGYESRLWLYDGKLRQLTALGQEGRFQWENEYAILFPAVRSAGEKKRAEKKDRFTSFYRLDIRGGEALPAFTLPFPVIQLEHIQDSLWVAAGYVDANYPDYYKMSPGDRDQVAAHYADEADYEVFDEVPFWANGAGITNKQRTALFTIHLDTLEVHRATEPLFDLGSMVVKNGFVYFTGECRSTKPSIYTMNLYRLDPAAGTIRTIAQDLPYQGGPMKVVHDKLWILTTQGERYGINENAWIYEVNTETGELKTICQQEHSLYGIVGSDCRYGGGDQNLPKDGKLFSITTREGSSHLYAIEPDGASVPVLTKEGSIDAISLCEESDTILMIAMYDGKLQELYGFDLSTGSLNQLSHFNGQCLKNKYIADYQPLSVQSEELTIGGWVLLPRDYDPSKTYPAILDIHGGPKTVFGPVFYHEMQLWANMGYFVFFCNPKGSDGRDNDFMDIRGQYGHTDYKNLMDFTDAVLEAYPQIDKARVCVTGGSYGGFMTNWIIGHTHRFCCAASQRSISNWLSFYGVADIGPFFVEDQCAGTPFQDAQKLWDLSPMKYASHVKTPTLFIHADQDYRCPLDQGLQMYTSLVQHGISARLCMFHGENHELSRSGSPKHRVRRLEEITAWFQKFTNTVF